MAPCRRSRFGLISEPLTADCGRLDGQRLITPSTDPKSGASRIRDRLDHAVMASNHGHLNPEWVEWLMGRPIGWTDLKPLAMDKFH